MAASEESSRLLRLALRAVDFGSRHPPQPTGSNSRRTSWTHRALREISSRQQPISAPCDGSLPRPRRHHAGGGVPTHNWVRIGRAEGKTR